jgi:nitrite reductase/ring-hydroxylating ferredoxin subunit
MKAPTLERRVELPLCPSSAAPVESRRADPAWREDFPTDWPQDHYVARRDFTKFLMLTSLPFALVQVGLAVSNWLGRQPGQPPVRAIARREEVPVGGVVSFHYPGEHDPCLLVRIDEQTMVAYNQKCTHLGCPVAPEVETKQLFCPCHLGYFDLATGRPTAGPPRRPLPRIALEERDGVLYAVGVEKRA